MPRMKLKILVVAVGLVSATAAATDTRWGWDGGCGNCPEHLTKDSLTDAVWIRLSASGDFTYPTKTSPPSWAVTDQQVNDWHRLGKKIILRTSFHPPGLTDAEIAPWAIEYNRQVLDRYGDKLYGIQPLNEPWLGDEWSGDEGGWAYQHKRLGATTPPERNAYFWKTGYNMPMATTNDVTPDAVAWFKQMAYLLTEVRHLAAAKGVKVYGPHWQEASYDASFNNVAKQCGVFNGIDVYSFGCGAGGDPLAKNGWATYIDDIIPLLDGRPWACVEFHLNDEYVGGVRSAANYTNALHIQKGIQHWRDMGVQCVLPHIGLQNWNTQINLLTSQLCGYVDDRPKDSLRVIMDTLGASAGVLNPVLVERLDLIAQRLLPPAPVAVSQSELDACYGVSATSAKDIVAKHRGKIIGP